MARLVSVVAAALLASLAACATGRPAEPDVMDVAGLYEGCFDVDGQPISGTLELRQSGTSLTGTFASPAGVRAEGSGSLDGDRIRMEFSYVMECPGTARIDGRVRDGGTRIDGTFTADDCTGGVSGTFSFERGRAAEPRARAHRRARVDPLPRRR